MIPPPEPAPTLRRGSEKPKPEQPPPSSDELDDPTECPETTEQEGSVTLHPKCACDGIRVDEVNLDLVDARLSIRTKECLKPKTSKGRVYCQCVMKADWIEAVDDQKQCDEAMANAREIVERETRGKATLSFVRPCFIRE
ncbi:MAG: hypothetical protein HYV07_30950 [Deltaproteobacteria bacterium]|nr:hypothetical protein [Deltaproteobacteria bacterium]